MLSRELDRVIAESTEALYSWWATDAEGDRFPYRLTYLSEQSDAIAGLYDHPRTRRSSRCRRKTSCRFRTGSRASSRS